jgi:hypothetical protein
LDIGLHPRSGALATLSRAVSRRMKAAVKAVKYLRKNTNKKQEVLDPKVQFIK